MSEPNILILAVTRMRGGVCIAGMTSAPDSHSVLRWVRPVKAKGSLLLGDIRYPDGVLMGLGDVVAWRLGAARPDPPHIEDVLVDPVRDRPHCMRRLDAARRAHFCAERLDRAPDEILVHEARSLCLVRPAALEACWSYDSYNGHYEARMAFRAGGFATGERGIPVTDLAWRALGRAWLCGAAQLRLDDAALRERIGDVYLAVGRGRTFEGRHWPLVVGVHAAGLPEIAIDQAHL
jgi:Dual OB-containing domain